MKLDDLHRILSNPREFSFYEMEDAVKKAAEIICLVDDWAAQTRIWENMTSTTSAKESNDKLDKLKDAYNALFNAAKGE